MPSGIVAAIQKQLRGLGDPTIAEHSRRFFKTGPGEYGEGGKFLGIRVPVLRGISKRHKDLPLAETALLLQSQIHEERLLALLILVLQYQKGDQSVRKAVFDLCRRSMAFVNNWDLVDCSLPKIAGDYLRDRSRRLPYRLAKSRVLWERRIAIMSTAAWIQEGDFEDTLEIAELLLDDDEDLIHKAVAHPA